MCPRMMPLRDKTSGQPIEARSILTVAKHGWLAVFLHSSPQVYLLLQDEYLVFDRLLNDLPLVHKRLLDMNSTTNPELYFHQTQLAYNRAGDTEGVGHGPR